MCPRRELESLFRREAERTGRAGSLLIPGLNVPTSLAMARGGDPATEAGLGQLSWQREEACFSGPGLPWGQLLLGWYCPAQPLAQPDLS